MSQQCYPRKSAEEYVEFKCRHRLWWYDSDAISNIVVVLLLHKLRYAREIGYINKQGRKLLLQKICQVGEEGGY